MINCNNLITGILAVNHNDTVILYNEGAQKIFMDETLTNKKITKLIESLSFEICVQQISLEHISDIELKTIYVIIAFKTFSPKNINDLNCFTLRKILDNCHDEIFVVDNKGNSVYANKAAEKNYGVKVSDLIGKASWQLAEEGICSPPITPIALSEKKKVTIEQTTRIGRKLVVTASPILDQKGEIDLIVENSRDITELKNIKQDLEVTRELLEKYKREVEVLRKEDLNVKNDIIANSKQMCDLLDIVHGVATTDSTILILGKSGTGKSILAKHIHKISKRKDGPFITINCAAIPEQLLESELFGYTPGAFSGASKNGKVGLLALANNGTLFFDEIAEIPIRLQAKLLEVIQGHRFTPVGSVKEKLIDVRIIAATNQKLKEMVNNNSFREDLFYRLNVIELEMPPLKERLEDIIPLIYFFLERYDKKYERNHDFTEETLDLLTQHDWPGNIRELEHTIERLVVTVKDTVIKPKNLPKIFHDNSKSQFHVSFPSFVPLDKSVEEFQKQLINKAYKQFKNTYKVAEVLQISQSKAYRLIKKYTD